MKTQGDTGVLLIQINTGNRTDTSLSAFAHPELCFAKLKLMTYLLYVKRHELLSPFQVNYLSMY